MFLSSDASEQMQFDSFQAVQTYGSRIEKIFRLFQILNMGFFLDDKNQIVEYKNGLLWGINLYSGLIKLYK